MSATLILTVGGSPEPLVHHIRSRSWDRVVFVCSEDDPVSQKKGSYAKVSELVASSEIGAEQTEIVRVPADDPSTIYDRCLACIRDEGKRNAQVVVDYTGGTKSMSAMLLLCALSEGAEVAVVLGPRTDLQKVRSGTESVFSIDTRGIESRWALDIAARAWSRFDYESAAETLGALRRPTSEASRVRTLSRGYAHWTAFDYRGARELLEPFGRFVPAIATLTSLASDPTRASDAARIYDLWLASERHALAARFDIAVLLLYRANEAIPQWALRWEHGIDPSDVPADSPAAAFASERHDGDLVLGQHAAWLAIAELGGPLASTARATEKSRLDLAQRRNDSVLAHGATPLTAQDHHRVRDWFESEVLPGFVATAFERARVPDQLPRELPAF